MSSRSAVVTLALFVAACGDSTTVTMPDAHVVVVPPAFDAHVADAAGAPDAHTGAPDARAFDARVTPDAAASPDAHSAPDAALPDAGMIVPTEDLDRDIIATGLQVDVTSLKATATIEIAPSTGTGMSFEAAGLTVTNVSGPSGPLAYKLNSGRLDIGVPISANPTTLTIQYAFARQDNSNGFLEGGSTLIWPYFCGNLFPCHSHPNDGTSFTLALTGIPDGQIAIYPTSLPQAPSYQIAWALGAYTEVDLGMTTAGTDVKVWYRSGEKTRSLAGTKHLTAIFDYYEKKLGPYYFGDTVGAIPVTWTGGALGGMEHHPYWHVESGSIGDEETNAHEAAHGWFGDGVRIACWEDFLLSEGTVSYLAARSLTDVVSADKGQATWDEYQQELDDAESSETIKKAWFPDTCNMIDIEAGYFSDIPYMKGAFFLRALEQKIGAPALDAALADFYAERVGTAARYQDLLDTIEQDTGYDPTDCAIAWLRSDAVPVDTSCP